jgi:hemerythrin
MPQLIDWSDEYLIGFEEIDAQHKRLITLVNNILSKCYKHQPKEHIMEAMKILLLYTRWHFQTEDTLMRTFDYVESQEHRDEHNILIKNLMEMHKNYIDNPKNIEELYKFYFGWFGGHAFSSDKEMADFFNKKLS